jgi:hypothetical protein
MADESRPKHPGGRPKGAKSHDNNGIFKKCPCPRRKWAKCSHSWFFAFRYKRLYRFSLNKLFDKPSGYWMSKSESDAIADDLRTQIRAGTFRPQDVTTTAPGDDADTRLTFADVAERYCKEFAKDPNRRPHRAVRLTKQFEAIGRTDVRAARLQVEEVVEARHRDVDRRRPRAVLPPRRSTIPCAGRACLAGAEVRYGHGNLQRPAGSERRTPRFRRFPERRRSRAEGNRGRSERSSQLVPALD